MAQYPIKHSCGHTITHQLYGASKDRERKESWLKTQPCQECDRKQKIDLAQETAQSQRLPTLQGSEKQIEWAERIRAEKVRAFEKEKQSWLTISRRAIETGKATVAEIAEETAKGDAATTAALNQTSSAWWIDRRDISALSILQEFDE